MIKFPFRTLAVLATAAVLSVSLMAQTDVLTWHNNVARTGLNSTEAILTTANVNSKTFGLLANVVVDGKVDAQPLYVSGLDVVSKGVHNVLYVATEHETLYALDADTGVVLWKKSLLGANETASDDRTCPQVTPEVGITATPVIDRKVGGHGTIFVVAMSRNAAGTSYYHRIHALDLSTGAEQFNGPVLVRATYPGTGDGSANGVVTFDPPQYKDRPGLMILNGLLYTTWGSHCDRRPYAGWLISYNETTLAQNAVLNFAPNGFQAAPWNAGAAPAADPQGNIYLSLGNGSFDTTFNAQGLPSGGDYGNSLIKVTPSGNKLTPVDFWTMDNSNIESGNDMDLGAGGLMLLPPFNDVSGTARRLAVAAGKDHNIYVVDTAKMGHYDRNANTNTYQVLANGLPGGEWNSPAYFNAHVYYGSVGQNLRSFEISQAKLVGSPVQITSTTFEYPGTTPSISAYNTANAIVWAPESSSPAILHAYDANNIATELYNSAQAGTRDEFGDGNKFIVPTIANGKVYIGTQNSVGIFGLLRLTKPAMADGDHFLTNAFSKLTLEDTAVALTTAMEQEKADGGSNQIWFLSSNGSGYYTIESLSTKLFLTNMVSGSVSNLRQAAPTHDATQLWSLTSTASGYVIKSKSSGLALNATNATAGANITLTKANGTTNQAWQIH